MLEIKKREDGVIVTVRVQPHSSRTGIVGIQGKALKIKVCSPSQEGRANQETIELLTKFFKIPKSKISILSGKTSRNKGILLHGADHANILRIIKQTI